MTLINNYCDPSSNTRPCVQITLVSYQQEDLDIQINQAMLDTGSFLTLVPTRCIQDSGAIPTGERRTISVAGEQIRSEPYLVKLRLRDRAIGTEVYVWDREYALLGRDFLKHWHIEFDGPRRKLRVHC